MGKKKSTSLNDVKHNFRLLNGWIRTEFIVLFIGTPISYPILMLLFYQFCLQLVRYIHICILSQSYHDIVVLCMVYVYECVQMCSSLYLCILLCNRSPWKNSVTEWLTLCKINTYTPVFTFSHPFAPPLTSNPGSALEIPRQIGWCRRVRNIWCKLCSEGQFIACCFCFAGVKGVRLRSTFGLFTCFTELLGLTQTCELEFRNHGYWELG